MVKMFLSHTFINNPGAKYCFHCCQLTLCFTFSLYN